MNDTGNKPLANKIDFAVIISVSYANPNGDPLNGNRPRQTYEGVGEISDVCLKRKIRNRLQDMGESIFVQSDDNRVDDCRSLNERFKAANLGDIRKDGCAKWFDVRAFGQVFAFSKKDENKKKKNEVQEALPVEENIAEGNVDAVSIGIRGPVTIQSAFSREPIIPDSLQIVKSVNLETDKKNPDKKGSDTMGMSTGGQGYIGLFWCHHAACAKTMFIQGCRKSNLPYDHCSSTMFLLPGRKGA